MSAEHSRVAILASGDLASGGGGSTVEKVARDVQEGTVSFTIGVVVCNNPEGSVGVYPKIESVNQDYSLTGDDRIDVVNIGPNTHPGGRLRRGQTLEESHAINKLLVEREIDFVWMLGYMRILNTDFVGKWCWLSSCAEGPGYEYRNGIYHPNARVGNNHPAILPFTADTYGSKAHQKVIDLRDKGLLRHTAMTWHLASRAVDGGPIITEQPIEIEPNYDAEELATQVQLVEKEMTSTVIDNHLKLRAEHLRIARAN